MAVCPFGFQLIGSQYSQLLVMFSRHCYHNPVSTAGGCLAGKLRESTASSSKDGHKTSYFPQESVKNY